jgi:hypothetical protein
VNQGSILDQAIAQISDDYPRPRTFVRVSHCFGVAA